MTVNEIYFTACVNFNWDATMTIEEFPQPFEKKITDIAERVTASIKAAEDLKPTLIEMGMGPLHTLAVCLLVIKGQDAKSGVSREKKISAAGDKEKEILQRVFAKVAELTEEKVEMEEEELKIATLLFAIDDIELIVSELDSGEKAEVEPRFLSKKAKIEAELVRLKALRLQAPKRDDIDAAQTFLKRVDDAITAAEKELSEL